MISKKQFKSLLDTLQGQIERIKLLMPEGYSFGFYEAPSGSRLIIEKDGKFLNLEEHFKIAASYYYIDGTVDTLHLITDKNFSEIYNALGLPCLGAI